MVDKQSLARAKLNSDLRYDRVQSPLPQHVSQSQTPAKAQAGHINQNPFKSKTGLEQSMQSSNVIQAETPAFEKTQAYAFQGQNPSNQSSNAKGAYHVTSTNRKTPAQDSLHKIKRTNQTSPKTAQKALFSGVGTNLHSSQEVNGVSQFKVTQPGNHKSLQSSNLASSREFRTSLVNTPKQPSPNNQGSLQSGKQFRLQYEQMPRQDPDLDSDRMTIDQDRDRQPARDQSGVQDGDHKSDHTVHTEMMQAKTGDAHEITTPHVNADLTSRGNATALTKRINKFGSASVNAEEQSVMTQVVVNSARFQEQDQYQDAINLQLEYEPISLPNHKENASQVNQGTKDEPETNSHKFLKTEVLMRANHQQSQSLEQLPSLRELNQKEDGSSRQKPVQVRNSTHQTRQFDVSSQINQRTGAEEESSSIHNRSQVVENDMRRNKNMLVSEFADTERCDQEHLVKEPVAAFVRHSGQDSIIQYDGQTIEDSVADTNMLDTRTQRLPVTLLSQQEQTISEINAQPSVTEPAVSILDSIDAKRSDMINLGPFEEEKSTDWNREKTPVQRPVISRQSMQNAATEHKDKEANARNSASMHAETPDYQGQDSSQNRNSQKKEPTNLSSGIDYYSEDKFELLSSQPIDAGALKNVAVTSVRAPTESQEDDHGQEEFYESLNNSSRKKQQTEVTKNFVDAELNPSHQQQDYTEHAGGMVIIEESQYVNTVVPNFEGSNVSTSKHRREVKSFDLNASPSPQNAKPNSSNSQKEEQKSGIEQFESDGEFNNQNNQYSSIQHTSVTVDGPQQAQKFSLPHSINDPDAPSDSMAFDTVHKQAQDTSMGFEKDGANEYGLEIQEQQILEDPEDAQNVVISVRDDSEKKIVENDCKSETQQPQLSGSGLKVNGNLPDDQNNDSQGSQTRILECESPLVKQDNLTVTMSAISRDTPIESHVNADNQNDSDTHSPKQVAGSRRVKKKGLSQEKRKSKSPRRTKSPASKNRKSKSPNDKRVTIQNGRVISTNQRDFQLDQHQFPIRKSNYDQGTVERMLLSKNQFNKSVGMLKKMKQRIQKYNKDYVPFAQQYYYAMQNDAQNSLQNQQDSIGMPMNSIELHNSMDSQDQRSIQTPFGNNNQAAISLQDQSRFGAQNLPQFLKSISKPRQDDQWAQEGINNIQVANSNHFRAKRASNSQPHLGSFDTAAQVAQQNLQTSLDKPLSENSLETVPMTVDGQANNCPTEEKKIEGGHSFVRMSVDQVARQHQMAGLQQTYTEENQRIGMNGSPLAVSPEPMTEFRFRPKKANRRLLTVNQNSKEGQQIENYLDDQSAYNKVGAQGSSGSVVKSTPSSFYPQDNLSLLLHASSAYPMYDKTANQIQRANLSANLSANQFSGDTRMKKNKTIGRIYTRSNARNLQRGLRVLPGQQKPVLNAMLTRKTPNQELYLADSFKPQSRGNFSQKNSHTALLNLQNQTLQQQDRQTDSQSALILEGQNSSQRSVVAGKSTLQPKRNGSLQGHPGNQTQLNEESRRYTDNQTMPKDATIESALDKFQRWLSKGKPMQNMTPSIGYRRNVFGHLISSSARVSEDPTAFQQNTPYGAKGGLDMRQTHNSEEMIISNSSEMIKPLSNIQGDDQKINLSMAVKLLNDPNFGETADERKIKLRSYIVQNYPQKFLDIPQSHLDPDNLQMSLENLIDQRSQQAEHLNGRSYRGNNKMFVQQNARSFDKAALNLAKQSISSVELPKKRQQDQMRLSHQPGRQFVVPSEVMQPFINEKLTNLSQIYAVPQGRKRTVFLANNYVKGGHLLQKHTAKNDRLVESRKSRSPTLQTQEGSIMKKESISQSDKMAKSTQNKAAKKIVSSQAYRALRAPFKKKKDSATTTGRKESRSDAQDRSHISDQRQTTQPANSKPTSQSNSRMSGSAVQQRHQHHAKNVESLQMGDTFEHPQISLNMPLSNKTEPAEDTFIVSGEQVHIDKEQMHILAADASSEKNSKNELAQEPTIDDLQERDVVDQENSQDQPQVLAEDDKNPNLPEQQDQILGEQTISEDEAGEERQAAAASAHQNMDSFRLPRDTDRTEQEQNQITSKREQEQPLTSQQDRASDGYDDDKFESQRSQNIEQVDPKEQVDDAQEEDEDEEEEEEEDYYADDKFVYEDMAEDPSSEDPEQKFLKKHAKRQDLQQNGDLEEGQESRTANGPDAQMAHQNSLEQTLEQKRRRTSQSHLGLSGEKRFEALSKNNESERDGGDDYDDDEFA